MRYFKKKKIVNNTLGRLFRIQFKLNKLYNRQKSSEWPQVWKVAPQPSTPLIVITIAVRLARVHHRSEVWS